MEFKNGDVFDIGQTVNGISKFIYINGKWHYYSKQLMREYEYDQADLEKTIININEYNKVQFIGNIYTLYTEVQKNEEIVNNADIMHELRVQKLIDKDIFDQATLAMEEHYGSGCETEIDAYFRGAKWMQQKLINDDKVLHK